MVLPLPVQKYAGNFSMYFKFQLFTQNIEPDPVLSSGCVEMNVQQNLLLCSSQFVASQVRGQMTIKQL